MYLKVLAKGKTEMGESGLPPSPPPKFDMDKFERGRKFIHDNVICHALAMFISLVCGLSVVNLLEPLLFTNQSDTARKALKRYESTFSHVVRWYYGDVWDRENRAHKSILAVRNMHNNVRKNMTEAEKEASGGDFNMSACPINKKDVGNMDKNVRENMDDIEKKVGKEANLGASPLNQKDIRIMDKNVQEHMADAEKESNLDNFQASACTLNSHDVRLSQYDMSLVQCGFIGSVVMYPDSLGMKCTEEELDDFVYFWYAIGYLLGITDKNNICRDGYKVTRAICKEIEQDVLLPSMRNSHPQFIPMAKALVDGSNIRNGFKLFSVESVIAVGYHGMQQKVPELSLPDYCRYLFLRGFLNVLYFCPPVKRLFCKLIQKVFWGSEKVSKIKRHYD